VTLFIRIEVYRMPSQHPLKGIGPGLTASAYRALLATDGYTGWYDERGVPAPWPPDFCDPDCGWEPTPSGDAGVVEADQPS